MTPHRPRYDSGSFRLSDPRKILRRSDRSDAIADFVLGIVVGVVAILALAGFIQ
jgi:hypothetical protein